MATFKICVFEHQKRRDGKFPVTLRIFWKGKSAYLKTEYYVADKQVKKKISIRAGKKYSSLELRDPFIIKELNTRITKYENLKSQKLGHNIELYTAKDLSEYFKREGSPGTDSTIDFIAFARDHCQRLVNRGKGSTAATIKRTVNMMIDFCGGRESISITEINLKFLSGFESYLKGTRIIKRKNQLDKIVTTTKKGLSDISVIDYMTDIRTVFNAAIEEYNDEDRDEIRIKHYPFRKYKLKKAPESTKRILTAQQVKAIQMVTDEELKLGRAILARDVFMLSFYLSGMNLADLYHATDYRKGRISYNRQKTMDRRRDKAFISLKVFPEAAALIEKYKDNSKVLRFYKMYSTSHIFSTNINKGLKVVARACKIEDPLSTYYARFSFATIARNDCSVSKDDINLSLDHVDASLKMADVYINKDWSRVDNTINKVIDHLNSLPLPVKSQSPDTL